MSSEEDPRPEPDDTAETSESKYQQQESEQGEEEEEEEGGKISLEPTDDDVVDDQDAGGEQNADEEANVADELPQENGDHLSEHVDEEKSDVQKPAVATSLSQLRPTLRGKFDVEAGSWIGEWAMSADEYENGGVRGKFEYHRTSAVPDVEVGKPPVIEGQPPDMYVSGYFMLQNPLNPQTWVEKKEHDILMRFSADPEGTISVQGYGKNEFGAFSLDGTFDVATSALDLYRAYQPRASDAKKPKYKKKSAPTTPASGAASRKTSRPTPRPASLVQSWEGASAGPAAAVSQRQRRAPTHVFELGEEESKVKARMLTLIDVLLNQDKPRFFHVPVDPVRDGIPHYHDVIKDPMDLGTVKKKLLGGEYSTEEQVAADVNLTFSNAMVFNPVGHPVYLEAKALLSKFETEFNKIIAKRDIEKEKKRKSLAASAPAPVVSSNKSNGTKKQKISSVRSEDSHYSEDESFTSASNTKPRSTKRAQQVEAASAAPVDNEEIRLLRKQVEMMSKQLESLSKGVSIQSKMNHQFEADDPPYVAPAPKRARPAPKPKPQPAASSATVYGELEDELAPVAKAPKTERPLSYQEKRALGQDINKLPADKVQRVLDIIVESGSQMFGDGAEEVEIDIEKLDTTTLKALQKYVREVLRTEKKKALKDDGFM